MSTATRMRHPITRVVVDVARGAVLPGFTPVGQHPTHPEPSAETDPYSGKTVVQLRAEIRSRNKGRDTADRLSGRGNKEALIAELAADDRP